MVQLFLVNHTYISALLHNSTTFMYCSTNNRGLKRDVNVCVCVCACVCFV